METRPWLGVIHPDATFAQGMPLIGPEERFDDTSSNGFFEVGLCHLAIFGGEAWTACAEHDAGPLRLFRVALSY